MQQNSIDTARLRPALRSRVRRIETLAERTHIQQHHNHNPQPDTPTIQNRQRTIHT